ncbi:hypothetical protein IQ272_24825 [Chroococcidiopsidales cyanobacterium LEGE 13417]|nr:hypothetical protein [Chroococcidiopsidales cyanobacterium LEGE 13417]
MNPTRTERIASIIQQRHPLAEKIVSVEENLKSLSSALYNLEEHRQNLLGRIDDPNILGYLQEIDWNRIQLKIATELEALGKLKVRFCRNTLNIGVVGRARQGKSRLLQSLTGLTAAEIPDGDRQHCTGVRSTVYHNPHVESYGEVWFHSDRSFLDEIISPYYEQLHLGAKPTTIEAFANKPLPPLPKELPGYAEPGAMYEHLAKYHAHISKYRHLLREASPRRILRDEIREYVAQDTPDGQRIFFNYLAVRQVKIVCDFPNADVGQIALVDMPGLGDTGVGDADRLMKTLGQDVDAVLFVRMPKSSGDYWADVDVRLYDTAHAALVELPIALWSFMVLNQTDANSKNGDNFNNCQDLAGDIANKHIQVKECITANCAHPQEANKVLDRVLDYLTTSITNLDREYAASCQERLLQLQNEVNVELEKSRQVLGKITQTDSWFPLFEQLFEQMWNNLTSGLEGLLRYLKERRNSHNLDLKQEVKAAIQACREDTGIPTLEQIEKRRDRVGGYPNAYYEYLHEIRAHLSQHFLLLDEGLKRSWLYVKSQLANILMEQGLGELTDTRGCQFLNDIANQLPESLPKLKLGFQIVSEFDMSYRELIQHRIRKQLDGLTPDETPLQISSCPSATEILANLKTLHAEAVYGCETALENLLCEPSQAAFAIVEEFVDRVLRAEGAKTEWRIFLEEVRSLVWQDEFEKLGDRTRLRKDWFDSIDKVATANQLNFRQFLN